MLGISLRCWGSRCTTTTNAAPVSAGTASKKACSARTPPAEAPMATIAGLPVSLDASSTTFLPLSTQPWETLELSSSVSRYFTLHYWVAGDRAGGRQGAARRPGEMADLLGAADRVADHGCLLLQLPPLEGPAADELLAISLLRLSLQAVDQRNPIVQRPQRARQRASEALVEFQVHPVGDMGVPDMAAIAHQVA